MTPNTRPDGDGAEPSKRPAHRAPDAVDSSTGASTGANTDSSKTSAATSATSESVQPLVKVAGLTKSYGGVRALRGVNFELLPGEVHALLGENGAGKSTMIKVLAGAAGYDSGTMDIVGTSSFSSPADSRAAGLAVVYQDLSLVPTMSVAANLLLGREPRNAARLLKRNDINKQAADFLADFGFPLNPKAIVSDLPFAYRQMTEIAKALLGEVKVLVLDEPTSALTEGEEEVLFEAVKKVTSRGVGVIYVTHRLAEVFRIADRATVFRDGANVGTWTTQEIDIKGVVSAIIGPKQTQQVVDLVAADSDEALAEPLAVNAEPASEDRPAMLKMDEVRNEKLAGVNLTVHAGEIVGLVGMMGAGRTEVLETIFGLRRVRGGTISICGTDGPSKNPYTAMARGVAMVPEDRHIQGLTLADTIERNIALPRLKQLTRWGIVNRRDAQRRAREAMSELKIKAPNGKTPVSSLSGGNQQKVVFGKWREPDPLLLLLDEPTVGVDVGGREEIYDVIRRAAGNGAGVIVASSDLLELLLIADRLDLVVDGRIVQSIPRAAIASEEQLHTWMQTASHEASDIPDPSIPEEAAASSTDLIATGTKSDTRTTPDSDDHNLKEASR